jgi:micrococcal nuclease
MLKTIGKKAKNAYNYPMERGLRVVIAGVIIAVLAGIFGWQKENGPAAAKQLPGIVASPEVAATSSDPGFDPVVRDIDGDTIVVLSDGATTTVRLIGVDTPETVDPRKPVECFGHEASAETKKLVEGQSVRLELDPSQGQFDKYGRTLAYVYLPDGTNLDEFLIAQGFGHEYTYKTAYEYQKGFKAAQAEAQKEQLGLWSPATCNGNTGTSSHEPAH